MTITENAHPAVVVYSRPACQPCRATKRALDVRGVEYTPVDVITDPAALDYIKKLGHQQSPVVVVDAADGLVHWSGFNPLEIERHFGRKPKGA